MVFSTTIGMCPIIGDVIPGHVDKVYSPGFPSVKSLHFLFFFKILFIYF